MTGLRWLQRVSWLMLLVLLTGCGKMVEESPTGAVGVVTPTPARGEDEITLPIPSTTPTMGATSAAPTAALPSPTPLPPSPQPLAPTPTSESEAIRIQFQPGATGASLTGTSAPGRADRYVLRAQAGQVMQASLLSLGNAVVLSIVGADGVPLVEPSDGQTTWRGRLSTMQDYFLHVIPVDGVTDYELHVDVAARIEFDAGATSATRQGTVGPYGMGWYVLRAIAGQAMEVEITSPGDKVLLTIVGEDGIPLKRYVDGETRWQGELLSTQDYYLQAESSGGATEYTLRVSISPLHLPGPERIEFAPGATSATLAGTLEVGTAHRYRLRALAGQRMEVHVVPVDGVDIAVEGEDGAFWSALPWEGSLIIGSLPRTQDYTIILGRVPPAGTTSYTLEVWIPPR